MSSERDDQTRTTDCLMVIHTPIPDLLGKRFNLEHTPTRIGRIHDAHIFLEDPYISRRHTRFDRRAGSWVIADEDNSHGTCCNGEWLSREVVLKRGDRIRCGRTIFTFLTGASVEEQANEELYRTLVMDGLTGAYNQRMLREALDREVVRSRRYERALSILLFDLGFFNSYRKHEDLLYDLMLEEVASIARGCLRRDDVFARHGREAFAVILPEVSSDGAATLTETLRQKVNELGLEAYERRKHGPIRLTFSTGAATLEEGDRTSRELVERAELALERANEGRPLW